MRAFLARDAEKKQLTAALNSKGKTAVLIYGKRRIGKSTLIDEVTKHFDGVVISHLCVQSTYTGNLSLLYRSVSDALQIPQVQFGNIFDLFSFLGQQNRKILLVLDEYQYLKASLKKTKVDSYLQRVIDTMPDNMKLVLCGSYITIMKELLEEDNPLFGRFQCVIHLREFDYYDAALFFPKAALKKKLMFYAVFGGSPYVLSCLDVSRSPEENIRQLLLPRTGILRTYIENVALKEMQKAYDIRIFEVIGNGKKKYSEITDALGAEDTGLLDKQLKHLLQMDTVEKIAPINRASDKKKQFYCIRDNMLRYYFTFIFGNEGRIARLGTSAFFRNHMQPALKQFVSLRFEDIVCQYFTRLASSGRRRDIADIGSYWYDDPVSKTNGQFDCVVSVKDGFDFYECKFLDKPMTKQMCEQEEKQLFALKGISCRRMGFVCTGGFDFSSKRYDLIDGTQLFRKM